MLTAVTAKNFQPVHPAIVPSEAIQ
jgi:hypothetical protein